MMANIFHNEILKYMLPITKEALLSPDWQFRESGILVLGAIAEGCMGDLIQYLPELCTFLIEALSDQNPLIRSITCWTLSRFAHWIVGQSHEAYLRPLIAEVCISVLAT